MSTEAMKGLGKCVSDIRREKNGLGMMQFDFGAGNKLTRGNHLCNTAVNVGF